MPAREIDGIARHRFDTLLVWTGNAGNGTATFEWYAPRHEVHAVGKVPIALSAAPAFRGDADRYNPEELIVASLSSCHMLWYLHLCAVAGIVVISYEDHAEGVMILDAAGNGHIAEVTLKPVVGVRARHDADRARAMHDKAHVRCFIARSVNFPVKRLAEIRAPGDSESA
jgi:organic hydroperoxide reductase OsmC/OhrA